MIWSVNSRDEEEKSSSSQDIYRGTFFPPMERGDRTRDCWWCRPAGAGAGTAVRRAPRRPRRVRFKCMMTPDDLLEMETRMYVGPLPFPRSSACVSRAVVIPRLCIVLARLDFDVPTTTQHIARQKKSLIKISCHGR